MSVFTENTILGRINNLLAEVTKQAESAMDTTGSAADDPGGYQGKTTHPSGDVDGGVGPAPLGSRASENEKDIKDTLPEATDAVEPGGVSDLSPENTDGTTPSETGGDASVEDDYDGEFKDPGTSHPANSDKIGDKYASMSTDRLCKAAEALCNDLLLRLADGETVETPDVKQAGDKQAGDKTGQPNTPQPTAKQAAEAGYKLASETLAGSRELAIETLASVRREAEQAAENLAVLLYKRAELARKQAEDQMPPDPTLSGGDGAPPSDIPPDAGPPSGNGAQVGPEDLAAMMGGGDPSGGDPSGAAPDPTGGVPGGDGDIDDQSLEDLFNALNEMGIAPEELLEAAQGATGVKAGSALSTPRVRKMCESMTKYAEDARLVHNLAVDVLNARDARQLKIKQARSPKQRTARNEIKNYLTELCGL